MHEGAVLHSRNANSGNAAHRHGLWGIKSCQIFTRYEGKRVPTCAETVTCNCTRVRVLVCWKHIVRVLFGKHGSVTEVNPGRKRNRRTPRITFTSSLNTINEAIKLRIQPKLEISVCSCSAPRRKQHFSACAHCICPALERNRHNNQTQSHRHKNQTPAANCIWLKAVGSKIWHLE